MINTLNQRKTTTWLNRYSSIFKEISDITKQKQMKILSFGCSTGEEVSTIRNYFNKKCIVHGLDINADLIKIAKVKNTDKLVNYFDDINKLEKYDLIFCMSVLLGYDYHGIDHYNYELFVDTLSNIDKLLKVGGLLCIYNSRYIFTDTTIFRNKYRKITTRIKITHDDIEQLNSQNEIVKNNTFYLFIKTKS